MPHSGLGVKVPLKEPPDDTEAVWVNTVWFIGFAISSETVLPEGGEGATVPVMEPGELAV